MQSRPGVKRVRGLCLTAAAGFAVIGVAGPFGGAARAANPPDYTYSTMVTAVGTQTALQENPEPSSVPDLTDAETPFINAQLDSYGTSQSQAHIANANGAGAAPSLICLASSSTCSMLSVGGTSFPPADPLSANAQNPKPQDASAPTVNGMPAQLENSMTGVGTASAHADTTNTTGTSTTTNSMLPTGVGTVGGSTVTTSQTVDAASLRTHAESKSSDINLGTSAAVSLVHIGAVDSISDVTSLPDGTNKDVTTTTVSGATVAGQPATIDSTGVHVMGSSAVPASATQALQGVLDNDLKAAGLTITVAKPTSADSMVGRTTSALGLQIQFDTALAGTPPASVGLPTGVPCPLPTSVTGGLPANPCAGVGISVNGAYHGQITLAQVGIVSQTFGNASDDSTGDLPVTDPGSNSSAAPATTATVPSSGPAAVAPVASSPTTTVSAAAPVPVASTPTSTTPVGAPAVVAAGTQPGVLAQPPAQVAGPAAPQVAGSVVRLRAASVVNPLGDLSGRIWWFFPALLLGAVGLLAGRFLKAPARLPLWLK